MKLVNIKLMFGSLSCVLLLCVLMLMPWKVMSAEERTLVRNNTQPHQETRIALLIGNGDYQIGRLSNPVNDVRDMAKLLRELGFEVIAKENLGRIVMGEVIRDFGQRLQDGGVGLFYFAGHGMQVNGHNYLIPVDANIQTEDEVSFQGVDVGQVLAKMQSAKNRLNIVVLDACRNNPYARSFRSTVSGLAKMDAPVGTLVAYATSPGRTAADGSGRNGTYTSHLLQYMKQPKLEIGHLFRQVRREVRRSTNNKQTPWEASSLVGEFYFVPDLKKGGGDVSHLTVQAEPADAQVRIMNINPKYSPGMALEPGDYHFVINAEGYQTLDQWRELKPGEQALRFQLIAKRQVATIQSFRDTLKDGSQGPEMVVIPAGTFFMGDIQGGGDKAEKPVHQVSIEGFAIAKTEVTVAEFRRYVKATAYLTDAEINVGDNPGCNIYSITKNQWQSAKGKNWQDPGFKQSENHPVVCVSWNDAQRYIAWLKAETGKHYRLASEAEWEYVARAGSEDKYSFGNHADKSCQYGNAADRRFKEEYMQGQWSIVDCRDDYVHTAPVASFKANAFGLYDMHGNVWEWVQDCWNKSYEGAPKNGRVWVSGDCGLRVLRGGDWKAGPKFVRSAPRNGRPRDYRSFSVGFRLARTY